MGQKRITLDLTEYEARILRFAVHRAATVTPESYRNKVFQAKLNSLAEQVAEATEGLAPLTPVVHPPVKLPRVRGTYRGRRR